uniref:Rho GTPase activating protein 32 n=1 Tax=Strix occidentalis caurina TaxID=311401 RepID=A0A8D0EPZ0_STROC
MESNVCISSKANVVCLGNRSSFLLNGLKISPPMMKSSVHTEEDDFVPELQRSIHPRERPDWEETLSAMARGADIPDIPGELPLRTCGSTASMKVKNVKKLSFTKGHFPKMAECAHFHYENVDFGNIQVSFRFLLCTKHHCVWLPSNLVGEAVEGPPRRFV